MSRAICRFCLHFVAPYWSIIGLHIKGDATYCIVRSIRLHNRQALLPVVWFTNIGRYLMGLCTQKIMRIGLLKILNAIRLHSKRLSRKQQTILWVTFVEHGTFSLMLVSFYNFTLC